MPLCHKEIEQVGGRGGHVTWVMGGVMPVHAWQLGDGENVPSIGTHRVHG